MADNDLANVQDFLKKPDAPAPPVAAVPAASKPQQVKAPSTITVFDNVYNRPAVVDPSAIASDPNRFAPLADQQVKMIGPDGKPYGILAKNAADAAGMGYSFQSDAQVHHEKKIEQVKAYNGGDSAFGAGAHAAVNNAFGGITDILARKYNPDLAEAQDQIQDEHPIASGIGTGLGIAGNLAMGSAIGLGGIASTVERGIAGEGAGLALRTLGRVAGGALEGAAYTAPEITAHLAVGDNQAAAESLGTAMAMGGVTHGVLGALGDGWRHFRGIGEADKAGLIAQGITDESGNVNLDKYQALSKNLETSKLGVSPTAIGALGEDGASKVSKLATDNGLESLDLSKLRTLKSQIGDEVKEATERLGKEVSAKPIDSLVPSQIAQDTRDAITAAHPGIELPAGGKLKGIDEYNAFMAAEPARNEMNRIAGELNKLGSEPVSLTALQDKLAEIQKGGKKLADPAAQAVHSLAIEKLEQAVSDARSQAFANGPLKESYAKYLGQQDQLRTIDTLIKGGAGSFVPTGEQAAKLGDLDIGGTIAARMARRVARGVVSAPLKYGIGALTGGGLGAIAGAPGFVLGSMAGGYVQKKVVQALGSRALEYAGASKALGLSTSVLRKVAENPETAEWLGAAMAKQVASNTQKTMTSVAGALAGKVALAKQEQGRKLDFDQTQKYLIQQKADETQMNNQAAQLSHVFGHDPELQSMVHAQQVKTINYLYDSIPKSQPLQPFQKQPTQPTKQQKKDFMDRVEIANDPLSILGHVKDGTLTAAHVDAFKTLAPNHYDQLVNQVNQMAHDPQTPSVSYGLKRSLQTLTGQNMTNPQGINYQQAIYGNGSGGGSSGGGSESAFPAQGGGKHKGGGPKPEKFKIDKMPDLSTNTQRRSAKGGF